MNGDESHRLERVQRGLAALTARLTALEQGYFHPSGEGFVIGTTRLFEKLVSGAYYLHQRDAEGEEINLADVRFFQGVPVSPTAPTSGQTWQYNAAAGMWEPASPGAPGGHVLADSSGLGPSHTTSGLTIGHFLRAFAADNMKVMAIQAGDLPGHTHTEAQIVDGAILARVGAAETITATWIYNVLQQFEAQQKLKEIAKPANPPAGYVYLYAKSDHKLYLLDSTGTETDLTSGGAGHDPVTLAADAQELLNLAGQELGFNVKAANIIFAGPASGDDADPTFRALVVADLPSEAVLVDGSRKFTGDVLLEQADDTQLIVKTTTHNAGNRPRIKFDNNAQAVLEGDDTEDQIFLLMSAFAENRSNSAILRIFGANNGWAKYVEAKHDGTKGYIVTDSGDLVLNPAGDIDAAGNKIKGLAAPTASGDAARKDEIDACEKTANKDAASGYCGLDGSALVPDARIPAGICRDAELAAHEGDADAHKGQKNSLELDFGDLQLAGDAASPGANKVYGTDGGGTKGWKADPGGAGAGDHIKDADADTEVHTEKNADEDLVRIKTGGREQAVFGNLDKLKLSLDSAHDAIYINLACTPTTGVTRLMAVDGSPPTLGNSASFLGMTITALCPIANGTSGQVLTGLDFLGGLATGSGSTVTSVDCIKARPYLYYFAGTVTDVRGIAVQPVIGGSPTITNLIGLDLTNFIGHSGANSVYGLKLGDLAAGAYRYPIYQPGLSDNANHFNILEANLQLFSTVGAFGGGIGVLGIRNAATVPSSDPSNGGVLYCEGGALKYRGSSGTVTTIANA